MQTPEPYIMYNNNKKIKENFRLHKQVEVELLGGLKHFI